MTAAGSQTPVILYITGSGRSGSTILHNLLCQLPGVVAVGEVRYIWDRGFRRDQMCGCGSSVRSCPFWTAVAESAFGGMDRVPYDRLAELTERWRIKDLPAATLPVLGARKMAAVAELTEALSRLYRAIAEVSQSDVIVDSSKNPASGYAVKTIEEVDFRALHFVRDAPAVAYSWSMPRKSQPGLSLRQQTPLAAAMQWNVRNLAAELYLRGNYRRMRYEDFVADPEGNLSRLATWIGHERDRFPLDGNRAEISQANHSVFGNEVRLKRGVVEIRRDDRWRSEMAATDRRRVAAVTFPLRVRYGYVGRTSQLDEVAR